MANGSRLIIDGACYHIMVRGNRKQKVFNPEEDFHKYISLLIRYKKRYKFKLYGYCLMPNHVHIIGQIDGCGKNLSKFMHGINLAYVTYFNNKYKKVGHLWQGRFKSKIIVVDKYLIDCINYIENNPVRAGMTKSPHSYMWSSYRERNMLRAIYNNLLDEISI